MPNTVVFVSPVRNAEKYVGKCLKSIIKQNDPNWKAIVVDDCSTDNTGKIIKETVGKSNFADKFTLVFNKRRRGMLYNIDNAITNYTDDPNAIIAILDGDDWLNGRDVVSTLLEAHKHKDIVWSQFKFLSTGKPGFSREIPKYCIARSYPWVSTHLKTFKKNIFDSIDKRYFLDKQGNYYRASGDLALMLPMLEKVPFNKRMFLDKILYVYNDENPLNEHKKPPKLQLYLEMEIRKKRRPLFYYGKILNKALNFVG